MKTRRRIKPLSRPYFKELDAAIGTRVRAARMQAGLPQTALGRALGITFQQIQKYEKGLNRISLSTMIHIARITKKPIKFFLPETTKTGQPLIADVDQVDAQLAINITRLRQHDRAVIERLVRELIASPSPHPPPPEHQP